MSNRLLRLPSVISETGYSRSTVYMMIQNGLWTRQVNLGARAVAWPEREVRALIDARIAGRSDDEIRALVVALEASRREAA
jgi:prophage regulatory protein